MYTLHKKKSIWGGEEVTEIQYCTGYAYNTCVKVADRLNYTADLQILNCNHNDLNSTTARYCNLLITFRGEFINYDSSKGYPTGIGLHVDEWAEEGGGPGSDGGYSVCCVGTQHKNLSR